MLNHIWSALLCVFILSSSSLCAPPREEHTPKEQKNTCIPRADLALHPFSGKIVWQEPSKIKFGTFYSYGGMKAFPYESSSGKTLTLSPWSDPRECLWVAERLILYNQKHMGQYRKNKNLVFSQKRIQPDSVRLNTQIGSLILDGGFIVSTLNENRSQFLKNVLRSAVNKGAERAYTIIPKRQGPTIETLVSIDFRTVNDVDSIEISEPSVLMMRQLDIRITENSLDPHWTIQPFSLNCKDFKHLFSVFLRESGGGILGGLFGNLYERTGETHAYIDVFYTDPSVRGQGYGRKLMTHADAFFEAQGIKSVRLDTTDFQAPWFYEKYGFKRVWMIPEYIKTVDGKLTNMYEYVRFI